MTQVLADAQATATSNGAAWNDDTFQVLPPSVERSLLVSPTAKQLLASAQLTPDSCELAHLFVNHVIPASAEEVIEPSAPTATHVTLKQLSDNHA